MRILLVHPSSLLYSEVYLRLEPLGLEIVAAALEEAGHTVCLLDLQIFTHDDFWKTLKAFAPDAIGFSVNYLANIPEVIDLAKEIKRLAPAVFVFLGGHSVSFVEEEVLEHGRGAIDCVINGEGELSTPAVLEAWPKIHGLPGVVTAEGAGPQPSLQTSIDRYQPARHLTRRRRKYFIGQLDPCASIEFSRGCPWECSFCSAWTFYGRTYRKADPELIAEQMARIREPHLFVVDDVAFIDPAHALAIADAIERKGIKKRFYVETRSDVLVRNEAVFARWARLGLAHMFLGVESLDGEQLKLFRKGVTPNQNFQALEVARKLQIRTAVNLITDPGWDETQFRRAQEWATAVPEIVHLTVATPYPGTELFHMNSREWSTTDYRLFDIQHAVTSTKLPLRDFYALLVETQSIINRKFMGWRTAVDVWRVLARRLMRGQTNFLKMLFKFSKAYNVDRFYEDHAKPAAYQMRRPSEYKHRPTRKEQFIYSRDPLADEPPEKTKYGIQGTLAE